MPDPVRVLHVLGGAGVGGVETFVRSVAGTLDPDRFAVTVCFVGSGGELAAHLRARGTPVRCLDSARLSFPAMQRLHGWIRAWQPHVLHANLGGRGLRWLARSAGCRRVICHAHGPPDELAHAVQRRDPRLRSTVNHAYGVSSDVVLTCSDWLRDSLCAIAPELTGRTRTLYCGVDIDGIPFGTDTRTRFRATLDLPLSAQVLGFVGRLVPQKGVASLVRVADEWLARQSDGHFLVIGDGPLHTLLDPLRDRFPGRVHLAGQRVDAATLIAMMDIMVVTSEWEPFGIVNLEAMGAGVPIVAFDVDGVAEVIVHGRTGLLVSRGDVGAMGEAVRVLMRDPERRVTMGRAGRERVLEVFSARRMADDLGETYDRLVEPRDF